MTHLSVPMQPSVRFAPKFQLIAGAQDFPGVSGWEYESCFQRELLKKLWLVEKLTRAEMFSFPVTPSSQIAKLIKKLFLKQRITQSFVVPSTRKTCSIERSLRFAVERDSPVIFVSVCGKYLKIASYRQISELLVEESFLKITLCINFKLQKTSTFLLSP